MFPRRLRPGQQYTASELSEMARTVAALNNASGAGGITLSREAGGFVVRDDSTPPIFGKITGAPTGAKYPWSQVSANDDGTFSVVGDEYGISGTAASVPAVELGGRTDVAVNSIVVLFPLASGAGYGFSAGSAAPPLVTISVVTSVCPTLTVTKDGGGFVTDVSLEMVVERRTITLPDGTDIGALTCQTDPTDCCGEETVACCDNPMPTTLYLTVSDGGGSYPLTYDAGTWKSGLVTVPGCGTFSFALLCVGSDFYLGHDSFELTHTCKNDGAIPFTVTGCSGADFESMTLTAAIEDANSLSCGCDGATRTFTVTP